MVIFSRGKIKEIMVDSEPRSQWLRAFIAAILVFGAMKVTRPVTLPLAFAIFLIVLAWPIQIRLENRLPSWLAFIITFMVFLLILGLFVGAMAVSANMIANKAPQYIDRLELNISILKSWAEGNGLSFSGRNDIDQVITRVLNFIGKGFQGLYSLFSFLALVLLILLFGLLEVRNFRSKLELHFSKDFCEKVVNSFNTIAEQYQRYIFVKTAISGVTGILVGLLTWVIGMDLAFIWGLLAFFLNYIPSLGSIISTVIITLFAMLQFQTWGKILFVFSSITGIQLFFGNWLDPRLQGTVLSLSPLVIVLSVIFWGWVWGIPGALLAVPLSIGMVIAFAQFEKTQWITALLAKTQKEK